MSTKRPIDTKLYAYATGRIRALETHLIEPARLSRFLEARSIDDVGRLLVENGYPVAPNPETSLNEGLASAYRLARDLCKDPPIIDSFLLAHDFHNLKVFLKALSVYWPRRDSTTTPVKEAIAIEQVYEAGGRPAIEGIDLDTTAEPSVVWPAVHGPVSFDYLQHLTRSPSTVEPAKLFAALRDQKPGDLPPEIAKAASAAAKRYLRTYDISEIDISLDKALSVLTAQIADEFDSPFFAGFVQLRTDLINVGILLRTRLLKSGADYLKRILLTGGMLSMETITSLYGETDSAIADFLSRTSLSRIAEAAAAFGEGGESVARFNLQSDDMLIQYVRKAKMVLRGPEVIIGYLIAREMEVKTIRVILTCLRNRIPLDKARELARLTYI